MLTINKVKELRESARKKKRLNLYVIPTENFDSYFKDELLMLREINENSITAFRVRDNKVVKIKRSELVNFKIV